MKWTEDQKTELRALCMAGELNNTQLAEHFSVPVTEIHAMRSNMQITIPKCREMREAAIVNPEFEAAIASVDEKLPIHKKRRGLDRDVKAAFDKLNDAILVAMARDETSPEDAGSYRCLGETVMGIRYAYDSFVGAER